MKVLHLFRKILLQFSLQVATCRDLSLTRMALDHNRLLEGLVSVSVLLNAHLFRLKSGNKRLNFSLHACHIALLILHSRSIPFEFFILAGKLAISHPELLFNMQQLCVFFGKCTRMPMQVTNLGSEVSKLLLA